MITYRDRARFAWSVAKLLSPTLAFPLGYLIIVWFTREEFSLYAMIYIVGGVVGGVLSGMYLMRMLLPGLMAGTLIQIRHEARS